MTLTTERPGVEEQGSSTPVAAPMSAVRLTAVSATLLLLIALVAAVHVVQGTAAVGPAELWGWLTGPPPWSSSRGFLGSRRVSSSG